MPDAQIPNPTGTYAQVPDFTLWATGYGGDINYERRVEEWRVDSVGGNQTIVKGDWVALTAAGTSTPVSVEQLDVSDAYAAFVCIGVALDAGTAGKIIRVVTRGPAVANIGNTSSPSFGDVAIKHASTDGASGAVAIASWDATKVAGTALGVYLGGAINSTAFAPVLVAKF